MERTRLAWTRTAVAATALGAGITRTDPLIGLPILAVTALAWAAGRHRLRGLTPYGSSWRFPLATGIIVGICATALIAVFA